MQWIGNAAFVVAICISTIGAEAAQAQGRGPLQLPRVGDRVRVRAPSVRDDRYVGRVESLPSDSITLDTAGVRRRLGFDMGPVLVLSLIHISEPTRLLS